MTKDEFTSLQLQYHQSGKSLKQFLSDTGICYSNYHYWDKKYKSVDTPQGTCSHYVYESQNKGVCIC